MKFTLAMIGVIGVAQAHFRSGAVSSREHFLYGKFVARMKAPNKKGTVSSFFTYMDGAKGPGGWNELDIEIVPSVGAKPASTNMIYGHGHVKLESHEYATDFDPKDEWHTYTIEWTPEYVSWSVDDKEMRRADSTDPAVAHMREPQSLRMNFWTPTFDSWGKGLEPEDMPWYLKFDYVEVYHYDMHTHKFDLHWRDDFEHFDPGRWFKQSGTFESNSSVFHTANTYTEKGKLVLKMEPEEVVEVIQVHEPPHPIVHEKLVHKIEKMKLHAKDIHE